MKNQKFELKGSVPNQIVDENGNVYKSLRSLSAKLGVNRPRIAYNFKKRGSFTYNSVTYFPMNVQPIGKDDKDDKIVFTPRDDEEEYQEFKKTKEEINKIKNLTFKTYNFKYTHRPIGSRYAVALFSDAHIEETVLPESVLNKNEYNVKIAEKRIQSYFENLSHCLNTDKVDDLIFASLGDTISGFIHEELAQCNGLTPMKAISKAQSLIVSGLQFICDNTELNSIKFIGIVGNHSRTTKNDLPIEFAIPESEVALVETPDNRTLLFCHGFQIKATGTNTVCGIYPSLQRLALKWGKTFNQDRIYLGHFHSCISIPSAAVNGSIIGYNSYSLTNGFEYQKPCQYYEVIDTNFGQLLERKIYCE